MRISDWSSDVCSSDLIFTHGLVSSQTGWGAATICDAPSLFQPQMRNSCGSVLFLVHQLVGADPGHHGAQLGTRLLDRMSGGPRTGGLQFRLTCAEIGRASCRERVCQYVKISVVAVSLKKKNKNK